MIGLPRSSTSDVSVVDTSLGGHRGKAPKPVGDHGQCPHCPPWNWTRFIAIARLPMWCTHLPARVAHSILQSDNPGCWGGGPTFLVVLPSDRRSAGPRFGRRSVPHRRWKAGRESSHCRRSVSAADAPEGVYPPQRLEPYKHEPPRVMLRTVTNQSIEITSLALVWHQLLGCAWSVRTSHLPRSHSKRTLR